MRSIAKGPVPGALIQWKADNAATPQNLNYEGGGFPREAVRQALLAEQFHLCAYTMRRLRTAAECTATGADTAASCHVEHLLPQARGIAAESIDYQNMLACFPPSQSKAACEYGAHAKKNYDPANQPFVSPLRPNAEQHFTFDDGAVVATSSAGEATVKVLNLNHKILVDDRRATIRGWLYPKQGKPVSAAMARRIAQAVTSPDAHGYLPAYCAAVAAAAMAHAERAERRAARLKGKGAP
ncbi:hypothetical protein [uncultured Thiodictyon sp.]|uniref:hypothetical protein n=1 Tax=uncultured Thiodictyon sp. TaxID=1846217 RepID=UPI0025D61DFA|nr:hypothetical protein [uncultured Thiodictyon sp.]